MLAITVNCSPTLFSESQANSVLGDHPPEAKITRRPAQPRGIHTGSGDPNSSSHTRAKALNH